MAWNLLAAALALAMATPAGTAPHGPPHQPLCALAATSAQLLPAPGQDAEPETGESEDEKAVEQGSTRGEDLQDGVLRPPRTGDEEAVKMPPAEQRAPSPADKPKRE